MSILLVPPHPATVEATGPPGFWGTLRVLLRAARRRSTGRAKRQRELLNQRRGKAASMDLGAFGYAIQVLFMFLINGLAWYALHSAISAGLRVQAENSGKIVVSNSFRASVVSWMRDRRAESPAYPPLEPDYAFEAREISREYDGSPPAIEQRLRDSVGAHGAQDLVSQRQISRQSHAFRLRSAIPGLLASVVLLWWGVMLIFQGEGLELDIQRRRHPLWEWLFSHPVRPGAVFLAEMLSPIAANPVYWAAPLFPALLYGEFYSFPIGLMALFFVGVPLSIAAACLGKALEIGLMLRFSVRTRGALIGLMSWAGYAGLMLFVVSGFFLPHAIEALAKPLLLVTGLPWPRSLSLFALFVGARADGSYSLASGIAFCWLAALLCTAVAVLFSIWGTQRGLAGAAGSPLVSRHRPSNRQLRFGKDPLYRKEFLWFVRDRSAIVQSILIPLTVAGFQLFNLRGLLMKAQGEWNYLCGAAILFGTYFLWVLGPKSLASEGQALWISLTWPRGLEGLLKAKAWLWSVIASGIVSLVLAYAVYLFPDSWWRIALVAVGWFVFARSMADKSVTLVTAASESGETQRIPFGRRGATQLGMLTFSLGVLTQQWHLAIVGIVYSWITAAAIWQNFRARLPFLFDPWSEKLPPPPTTMHAMVAISILVECGAVLFGIVLLIVGKDQLAAARAISYGISAIVVALGTSQFLSSRHVAPFAIWNWTDRMVWNPYDLELPQLSDEPWWQRWRVNQGSFLPHLVLGIAGGITLGLFAHGYDAVLRHIPVTAELIRKSQEAIAHTSNFKLFYGIMAIGFAPFAEEYLFRGLLYRALDREWGGWRAVVASAAFFAIYHPPLAWIPVFLVGVANAVLFKRTGRLFPCVLLHMAYNAMVLLGN